MAYSTANPPQMILQIALTTGRSMFLYESTDPHTDVDAVGYFTDGTKHGMKLGDIVIVRKTDTGATTLHSVITVGSPQVYAGHGAVTISPAVLS